MLGRNSLLLLFIVVRGVYKFLWLNNKGLSQFENSRHQRFRMSAGRNVSKINQVMLEHQEFSNSCKVILIKNSDIGFSLFIVTKYINTKIS